MGQSEWVYEPNQSGYLLRPDILTCLSGSNDPVPRRERSTCGQVVGLGRRSAPASNSSGNQPDRRISKHKIRSHLRPTM